VPVTHKGVFDRRFIRHLWRLTCIYWRSSDAKKGLGLLALVLYFVQSDVPALAGPREVEALTSYHPLDAAGLEQRHRHLAQACRIEPEVLCGLRQHLGRHRHKQVPRPRRHGDTKFPVRGGTAPPHVVIVHAREVVVYQRVRMDGFHRGGYADRTRAFSTRRAEGSQHQRRSDPLTGASQRIRQRLAFRRRHFGLEPAGPTLEESIGRVSGFGEQLGG